MTFIVLNTFLEQKVYNEFQRFLDTDSSDLQSELARLQNLLVAKAMLKTNSSSIASVRPTPLMNALEPIITKTMTGESNGPETNRE